MTDHLWLNAFVIIGIIGAAEEAVRRIVGRPLVRNWRKFEKFLDTWNGEPARDGLAARPGLVDRVIAIEYQVHNNGGGSMKDTVDEIAKAAKVAAEMATESASMATATKDALDQHVEQSKELIEQGRKSEASIVARQDQQDKVIADLSDALPIVARSTPPEDTRA